MNLQQQIFKKFFKDNKERTILAHNSFGDILFKEDETEIYNVLQIYTPENKYGKENPIILENHEIGKSKSEYTNFIKHGDFFVEPHKPELYKQIFFRGGLYDELIKTNPKTNYFVYVADKDNNSNIEDVTKLDFNEFCKLVLKYGKFD